MEGTVDNEIEAWPPDCLLSIIKIEVQRQSSENIPNSAFLVCIEFNI